MTQADHSLGIAQRLIQLRLGLYGEHGGPLLAMMIGVSFREWLGYEQGRSVPQGVLRRVAEVTDSDLDWLRTGQGAPNWLDRTRLDFTLDGPP